MLATAVSGVVLVVLSILLRTAPTEASKNMVCYYTNWPQYRTGPAKYTVNNVDPLLCTHLVFAFAKIENNVLVAYEYNDRKPNGGAYMALTNLKQRNPKLKTLLAVGGWTHGSATFITMAANANNRKIFIDDTIKLLRQFNFDGLDIDWEYPVETDKENLSNLIREIRVAFEMEAQRTNRNRLTVSMAMAAGIDRAKIAYDIPVLDRYVDMYNLMTYDYHGAWEKTTNLATPMRSNTGKLSVTSTIQWYKEQGASMNKVNLGVAFYARTWTLQDPTNAQLGSPAPKKGAKGQYTKEAGVLAYYEVCRLQKQGFQASEDPVGQTMYGTYGDQFITFENQQTLKTKLDYIISQGLAGAMVWSLDLDDFSGQFCGQGVNPLLTLIKDSMANAPSTTNNITPAPITPQPITYQPITYQPITYQPVTYQPVTPQPVTYQPVTYQPITPKPVTYQPITYQPITYQPVTYQPVTPQPVTYQPITYRPVTPQPPVYTARPPATVAPVTNPRHVVTPAPQGCPLGGGYVADPNSCSGYYVCILGGYRMKMTCRGSDVIFNPFTKNCEERQKSTFVCNGV